MTVRRFKADVIPLVMISLREQNEESNRDKQYTTIHNWQTGKTESGGQLEPFSIQTSGQLFLDLCFPGNVCGSRELCPSLPL